MNPIKHNVKAYEGASWRLVLTLRDPHGNDIDLTGYTALMQIRQEVPTTEEAEVSAPILELSTENGGIAIDASVGKILLKIDRVQEEYSGVYDLLLFSPSGIAYKLIVTSKFAVTPGVTVEP